MIILTYFLLNFLSKKRNTPVNYPLSQSGHPVSLDRYVLWE